MDSITCRTNLIWFWQILMSHKSVIKQHSTSSRWFPNSSNLIKFTNCRLRRNHRCRTSQIVEEDMLVVTMSTVHMLITTSRERCMTIVKDSVSTSLTYSRRSQNNQRHQAFLILKSQKQLNTQTTVEIMMSSKTKWFLISLRNWAMMGMHGRWSKTFWRVMLSN